MTTAGNRRSRQSVLVVGSVGLCFDLFGSMVRIFDPQPATVLLLALIAVSHFSTEVYRGKILVMLNVSLIVSVVNIPQPRPTPTIATQSDDRFFQLRKNGSKDRG